VAGEQAGIEKVMVFDEKLTVEFELGISIDVEN